MDTPLSSPSRRLGLLAPEDDARILSRSDSESLFKRIVALTEGGGDTQVTIRSTWKASLRWARNRPTMAAITTEQTAVITRYMNGVEGDTELDCLDDATMKAAVRQLEHELALAQKPMNTPLPLLGRQSYLTPPTWSDATYKMSPEEMSDAVRKGVIPVAAVKLVAAGEVEIGAMSWAIFNTQGLDAYGVATGALYGETVRLPDGSGSGWAGKSHMEWSKLDVGNLSATALEKCIASANPVKIEPGRYTAILEPKAVGALIYEAFLDMRRKEAENDSTNVYHLSAGQSKIGHQVLDSRLSITSDPMDPECGFIPFDPEGNPHRKVTWVENGILKALAYGRQYARQKLGTDTALPNPRAFQINVTGPTTSLDEMIASTERGIYVTRFGKLDENDAGSLNMVGVTRDGLWLIEHGKISHPIKNLWINESSIQVFNQVLQVGDPVRTYGVQDWGWIGVLRNFPTRILNDGNMPIVAPAIKVRDFNFVRLTDAI